MQTDRSFLWLLQLWSFSVAVGVVVGVVVVVVVFMVVAVVVSVVVIFVTVVVVVYSSSSDTKCKSTNGAQTQFRLYIVLWSFYHFPPTMMGYLFSRKGTQIVFVSQLS